MKSHYDLQAQLERLKLRFRFLGKAELRELRKILHFDEQLIECVYGYYQGGSGLLVATDSRILLIDKRPFYLNLEDISYDRIRDITLSPSWFQPTILLRAGHSRVHFRSLSDARLKRIKEYAQERMQTLASEAAQVIENLQPITQEKQYHNPAWRPRHTILKQRRPTKFYPLNSTVSISTE